MSKEGGIILYRKLVDSYAFTNETTLKIWIWVLLKASFKENYFSIHAGKGQRTVKVKRGQFIYGRNKAEAELKIPGTTIGRHLDKLRENKQINIEVDKLYSIITVCNYDSYQVKKETNGQLTDSQRTANGQLTDTYNNDNKENKNQGEGGKPPAPPKEKELEKRKAAFAEGLKEFLETYGRDMLNSFYKYWTEKNSTGKKMRFELEKTWETNLRLATWANRDKDFASKNKTDDQLEKEKQFMKSLGL